MYNTNQLVEMATSSIETFPFVFQSRLIIPSRLPDGKTIYFGSYDDILFAQYDHNFMPMKIFKGHTALVKSLAISPDGTQVVSGSLDKTVRIWDRAKGTLLDTLAEHTKFVTSVAISPDGKQVVSGSNDNTVRIWDSQTGQLLKTVQGPWSKNVINMSNGVLNCHSSYAFYALPLDTMMAGTLPIKLCLESSARYLAVDKQEAPPMPYTQVEKTNGPIYKVTEFTGPILPAEMWELIFRFGVTWMDLLRFISRDTRPPKASASSRQAITHRNRTSSSKPNPEPQLYSGRVLFAQLQNSFPHLRTMAYQLNTLFKSLTREQKEAVKFDLSQLPVCDAKGHVQFPRLYNITARS